MTTPVTIPSPDCHRSSVTSRLNLLEEVTVALIVLEVLPDYRERAQKRKVEGNPRRRT